MESCVAVWIPIAALVAPGPRVTKAAAGRRASFPYASAAKVAPDSWRVTTRRKRARSRRSPSRTAR